MVSAKYKISQSFAFNEVVNDLALNSKKYVCTLNIFTFSVEKIKTLEPERPFSRPSDMTPLAKDEFAVRDKSGINLFKANGDFLKSLDNPKFGVLFGLAYDPSQNQILTVNTNGMKNSRDNFSKVILKL